MKIETESEKARWIIIAGVLTIIGTLAFMHFELRERTAIMEGDTEWMRELIMKKLSETRRDENRDHQNTGPF